jgi:hypothetical protein
MADTRLLDDKKTFYIKDGRRKSACAGEADVDVLLESLRQSSYLVYVLV